jgi:hypothetical protein
MNRVNEMTPILNELSLSNPNFTEICKKLECLLKIGEETGSVITLAEEIFSVHCCTHSEM